MASRMVSFGSILLVIASAVEGLLESASSGILEGSAIFVLEGLLELKSF